MASRDAPAIDIDMKSVDKGARTAEDAERGEANDLDTKVAGKGPSNSPDVVPPFHTPGSPQSALSPPLAQLTALGRRLQDKAVAAYDQLSPQVRDAFTRALDTLMRILKLCGLTLMIIFVVGFAAWFIALSHWFTVVIGHLALRYTVPASLDPAFADKGLDVTMIFAGIGALVVNLPSFAVFLLSIPFTFDRTVVEGSTAPANELIQRIMPKNRPALVFLKYAPRLAAGPIGSALLKVFAAEDPIEAVMLDPLHAAMAGVAGELLLTGLGYVKNRLRRDPAGGRTPAKDTLPV